MTQSQSKTPGTRHARLFEYLRQDNMATAAGQRLQASRLQDHRTDERTRFCQRALQSWSPPDAPRFPVWQRVTSGF